jgi:hypothetical protein
MISWLKKKSIVLDKEQENCTKILGEIKVKWPRAALCEQWQLQQETQLSAKACEC